jgi:hypothetical protein
MKRVLILIFLGCLNFNIGNCQLLSKPSLTVKDFEKALTNAGHLSKILERHNFKYSFEGETKFDKPWKIKNPLIPYLRSLKSENWELKNQKDQSIFMVNIYEWEPNHAPHSDVIKTISVMINRNTVYADKMNEFLEEIKNKYPNKSKRYFRDSELYQQYGQSFNVFTNDSKIEVRSESVDTGYGPFYKLSFDLIK